MKFHYECYEYKNCAKYLLNHDSCVRLMKFGRLSRIQLINYDNSYITPVLLMVRLLSWDFNVLSFKKIYSTISVRLS